MELVAWVIFGDELEGLVRDDSRSVEVSAEPEADDLPGDGAIAPFLSLGEEELAQQRSSLTFCVGHVRIEVGEEVGEIASRELVSPLLAEGVESVGKGGGFRFVGFLGEEGVGEIEVSPGSASGLFEGSTD
jgi:hypothetical protein